MNNTFLLMAPRQCFRFLLVMLALWSGVYTANTAELPPLNIPVSAKPPLLDGNLDDPAWQSAATIENLFQLNSDTPAPETTLWLMRDNAWLYIAAHCRNPNMEHVTQLARDHDGGVITDDSLEIFLRPMPDEEAFYYYFALNFANVGRDQRCTKAGLREVAWNPYWRSVTQRRADGWTAEIAIPLYCLGTDDLSGCSINICRNMMEVELDVYGARQNETRRSSTLRPGNSGGFHNFANFRTLAGLGGFKPAVPFAPHIAMATIAGVRQVNGGNIYELELTLELVTSAAGPAQIKVLEDFGEGETVTASQTLELKGLEKLTLQVPAGDLRERKIKVALTDPADGNLLAARILTDTSALNIIRNAFAGRSYYTSEDMAEIRVELGLPKNMLKKAVLVIEVAGKKAVEMSDLQPVMTPGVPVANLTPGDNAATVQVLVDGRILAKNTLNIIRLEPRPGYETQADFIKGVLLKDKQPLFPVGIASHPLQMRLGMRDCQENDETLFKYLAEDIGFNFITRDQTAKNTAAFMELAEKYGLYVMNATARVPPPIGWVRGTWPPPPVTLPFAERLAHQRAWYDELEPGFIADAKIMRDYSNLIIYYNGDEPNLVNPDERIAVVEWYWKAVRPLDPYRPMTIAYSKYVPHGDNWTRWTDMLAYDVYPRAYLSEPGLLTAFYAYDLRERCRRDNKIMWFIPLANMLDTGRSPIGLSKTHMLCQAYTAIIYGARGLWYFALGNVVGPEAWDALRVIAAQVKEMTPALVNGDIPQEINYTPDDFRPAERIFPGINTAVFRYPNGDYLLMAVNIKSHAVDARFQVGGMECAARMFASEGQRDKKTAAQRKLELDGEAFADKIEPYGVRAWRLQLAGSPTPVQVAVEMTDRPEESAPTIDIQGIVRQVMTSKNHMPNPCFTRQTNKNVPDFYRPFFCLSVDPFWGQKGKSDWFLDDATLWNGHPSLRMFKRPYLDGGYKTRSLFAAAYPSISSKPVKLTFSLYAKSDHPASGLSLRINGLGGKTATFKNLSADWRRYHTTFELPAGNRSNFGHVEVLISPSENAVVWINGLQMEAGEQPTEFQDDSMLVKKK